MIENQEKWIRFRLAVVFLLLTFAFGVASLRAYKLQISKQTELNRLAQCQRKHKIALNPPRGVVYDRKYHELAVSVEVDSVYAHPWQISDHRKTAERLGNALGLNGRKLLQAFQGPSPFVWIARGISPTRREQVENLGCSGIYFIKENKRFYPNREIAGQLLGFVGIDGNGLEGLESHYDSYLNGGSEYLLVERDALGRDISSSVVVPLELNRGDALILTIDVEFQHILENELQQAVEKAHAKGGMGILMDPKTGEILALALQPHFNPNNFNSSSPHLWRNRIITDCFEPGSTFKVFLAAAAIEEGVVSPQDTFYCENGSYPSGGRIIHDVHKYGTLTLAEVIKYSSNIGAVKIGEKLNGAVLYEYVRNFGFGEKTNIDLPVEVTGIVRPYKTWREINKKTLCFGQGISVTAIQLLSALSAIANGGYLMQPYIVKAIVNEKGECLKKNSPRVVRKVISEKTAQMVTDMMVRVVSEDGTGKNARIPGYEVAGKTGTAQKVDPVTRSYFRSKGIGSFMGFVPARDPRVAMVIVIDEPEGRGFGGTVAAPAFKAVAEQVLTDLNVYPQPGLICTAQSGDSGNPQETAKEQGTSTTHTYSCSNGLPDFSGFSMRKVIQMVKEYNLTVHIEGSGRAVSQKPSPGTALKGISECWITFQPLL